jgi:hypothetical protein
MSDDQKELVAMRQQQVAALKPELYCVLSAKYEDVHLVMVVVVCFFTEAEAIKAKEYMEKEFPIPKAVGWYELEKTKLSTME